MKKIFVIDTNVLLNDPHAIYKFEENDIVIPLAVVEEIDDQKKRKNGIGYNARETSRILDKLSKKGKLDRGVKLKTGGSLKIAIDEEDVKLPRGLSPNKMDNRIISTAIRINNDKNNRKVILVSEDINIRLIANAFGLDAEEYRSNRLSEENIYSGFKEINMKSLTIEKLYENNSLSRKEIEKDIDLSPNEMVQLNAVDNDNSRALTILDENKLRPLRFSKTNPVKIRPRNREQKFAIELLMSEDIRLVTLAGKAGTGKTLLALAAGLEKVLNNKYSRLLITRPVIPMGKDIGFLPGSKEEKLQPWMQPIFDNLDFIMQNNKNSKMSFEKLVDKDLIQIEALTYIRGRSVPEQFIIVDEAQNLSKHEIKTIITRAGKKTKIVLTGDPFQIDNPYLDLRNNGLTYLAHKFHNQKIAGHIMLKKGERSELARIASEVL